MTKSFARLNETFVPEHYDLSLHFDRPGRSFAGTVTINGSLKAPVPEIRLHAKELTVSSALIDGKSANFSFDNDHVVLTHDDLGEGKHVIVISFSGNITDSMHGLYPSYYTHDGVKKELLATQFESNHAQEVFPCVDEPEAKATFNLTLTTEPGMTVLSNMPIKDQRTENDQLVTVFETTPRMSTYLLAWVIGELHKKSATTKEGVEVNVWATPAQPAESLDFALDIATRSIDFFDDYFGTNYPLPKSDHVALPDFSAGAMENWGLVTYREIALLVDSKTASLSTKQQASLTIAHEVSHQWFGNLVTMKWWDDLWLNESFANMMEYVAIDALQPDWQVWLEQASYEVVHSLKRDSLDGVQAIRTDIEDPDEINALFDPSIVYAKGGRLLRMLQSYIGDEAMQNGLKTYFKKFAYQNTEANDLWQCLGEASGQDIELLMNTWISQSGYPVVHVTKKDDQITLTQEQFFIGDHQPSEKLWPIPLGAVDPSLPHLLSERSLTVPHAAEASLILNHESPAHFIVHYTPELLGEILPTLSKLTDIDRLKLLNEQVLLAQANIISSAELIDLLHFYKDESIEAVWDIIAVALNELKKFVEQDESAERKLREFTGELAAKQYGRLGTKKIEGEPETDTKLRTAIVSLMIYSERPDVLDDIHKLYLNTPLDDIDPNLRVAIIGSAVRDEIAPNIIDDLLAVYKDTHNSELQEQLAASLTCTKNPAVITHLLSLLQDTSIIRPQDFIRWFGWLLRNRYSRDEAWLWAQKNWMWIEKTFKGDMMYDAFPRYIASCLMTREQLATYTAFFEPLRKQRTLTRNIEVGITELKGRVEHIERDSAAVRKALLDL